MTHKVRLSLGPEDRAKLKAEALRERPYAGRVSATMALHLLYNYQNRLDYFPVLDELDSLEGWRPIPERQPKASRTKKEEQFKHSPLDRFWHKHYSSPRHIAYNIINRWGLAESGSGKAFDAMFASVTQGFGDDYDRWLNEFTHRFVVQGYCDRVKVAGPHARLTGDWIVFGKHEDRNYYLALATHEEGKDGPRLFSRLRRLCEAEYPFLFDSNSLASVVPG